MRLDKFLSETGTASRSESKKAARVGGVTVNGVAVKDLSVHIDPDKDRIAYMDTPVIYQKYIYIMMNKPDGVISSTEDGNDKTVLDLLPEKYGRLGLFPCGRLDRDTTGCLLFAKNFAAYEAAVEKFKVRGVKKLYHAIVVGCYKLARKTINAELDGQEAVSKVLREAVGDDASFLKVMIETGRTNQIRRHLAGDRFPIIGDRVYGLKNARDPRLMQVPRQMLHASTIEMPHPKKLKETIKVHSPLPADFRAALKLFGMGK